MYFRSVGSACRICTVPTDVKTKSSPRRQLNSPGCGHRFCTRYALAPTRIGLGWELENRVDSNSEEIEIFLYLRGARMRLVGDGKEQRTPFSNNAGLHPSGTLECITGLFL